jgi:hypothetical protein
LGYSLNTILPSSVTTSLPDSTDGLTADIGNKTPNAGLQLTWAAGQFGTWLSAQTSGSIKWTVAAGDGYVDGGPTDLSRALVAFTAVPGVAPNNQTVRNAVGTAAGVSGLASTNNDGSVWYDKTGAKVITPFKDNNGFGADTLNLLDTAANLFYFTSTMDVGGNATTALSTAFANSAHTATLTLASSGVLTYDLQAIPTVSAVPVPPSLWLMGTGLAAMGAFMRRRRAAAQA